MRRIAQDVVRTGGRMGAQGGRGAALPERPVVVQRSAEGAEESISRVGNHTNRRLNGRTGREQCRRFLRCPRATQGFARGTRGGMSLAWSSGDWRHGGIGQATIFVRA